MQSQNLGPMFNIFAQKFGEKIVVLDSNRCYLGRKNNPNIGLHIRKRLRFGRTFAKIAILTMTPDHPFVCYF
jgi:hypothetical protein